MHGAGSLQQLCMVHVASNSFYDAGGLKQLCMVQVTYNSYV